MIGGLGGLLAGLLGYKYYRRQAVIKKWKKERPSYTKDTFSEKESKEGAESPKEVKLAIMNPLAKKYMTPLQDMQRTMHGPIRVQKSARTLVNGGENYQENLSMYVAKGIVKKPIPKSGLKAEIIET